MTFENLGEGRNWVKERLCHARDSFIRMIVLAPRLMFMFQKRLPDSFWPKLTFDFLTVGRKSDAGFGPHPLARRSPFKYYILVSCLMSVDPKPASCTVVKPLDTRVTDRAVAVLHFAFAQTVAKIMFSNVYGFVINGVWHALVNM